jgi:hypothetical protein
LPTTFTAKTIIEQGRLAAGFEILI